MSGVLKINEISSRDPYFQAVSATLSKKGKGWVYWSVPEAPEKGNVESEQTQLEENMIWMDTRRLLEDQNWMKWTGECNVILYCTALYIYIYIYIHIYTHTS